MNANNLESPERKLVMWYKCKEKSALGLTKAQISRSLGLDVKTVRKYLSMSYDEFKSSESYKRMYVRMLDPYESKVYEWLDETDPALKPAAWYWDTFDVTITPAAPTADIRDEDGISAPLAYHIFSSDLVPVMVIKLTADGQPAYLYSKGFYKDAETPVTTFEEGKIYRMSAKGEVEKDGSIPIDEDDIDPMDRCLEITVDVVDWAVELVYPEF